MSKKKLTRKTRPPRPKATVTAPDFPRFETTDFDDPDDFAVWAFAGLPHMKGAPLGIPVPMLRWISRRLWDCGMRFHPELRTIKYREPHAGMGMGMLTSAGDWVPIDAPDVDESEAARDAIAGLPDATKRQIVNALGLDTTAEPEDPGLVPYRKADGTTTMVTPAQARRYANAKKARKAATES